MGLGRNCSTRRRHGGVAAVRTLVAVVVVSGGLVVGALPAAGVGAIVVSPSTGLVDGQTVTITGSGWEPGHQIGYCQAVPTDTVSQSNCAAFPGLTSADANGGFTVSLFLNRIVTVQGVTYDCAAPSSPCVAAAADAGDVAGTVVSQPLDFAAVPPIIFPGRGEVTEGDSGTTELVLPVTLSYASTEPVSAQWATLSPPSLQCSGFDAADPASDYTAATGTVTFLSGDTDATLTISVQGDTLIEADECLTVRLSNPVNATLATNNSGDPDVVGFIRNDDTVRADLIIKRRSDGTLFFDNQFTFAPSPYFHTIVPGGTWTFAILVQNDGTRTGDLVVRAQSSPAAPFDVQYFYGYYDVTAAVEGGGLVFPSVAPGDSRLFAVRFAAGVSTPLDATAEVGLIASTSPVILGAGDALRLRVIAAT